MRIKGEKHHDWKDAITIMYGCCVYWLFFSVWPQRQQQRKRHNTTVVLDAYSDIPIYLLSHLFFGAWIIDNKNTFQFFVRFSIFLSVFWLLLRLARTRKNLFIRLGIFVCVWIISIWLVCTFLNFTIYIMISSFSSISIIFFLLNSMFLCFSVLSLYCTHFQFSA